VPLIYDVGMYDGSDTAFYLQKGFDVIAVEANPRQVEKMQTAFHAELASGRLTIHGVAVAAEAGTARLLVHDHDDWTRLDAFRDYRFDPGAYQELSVPARRFGDIYAEHETPYYVKLDIEGSETFAIRDIFASGRYPEYLSFEANPEKDALLELCVEHGYRRFNIVPQKAKAGWQLPNPPLEGNYVPVHFNTNMSGPFGREIPGAWMTLRQVHQAFQDWRMAVERGEEAARQEWHDIHAWRDGASSRFGWKALAGRLERGLRGI